MFDEDYGLPTLPHESSDYGASLVNLYQQGDQPALKEPSSDGSSQVAIVQDVQGNTFAVDFRQGKITLTRKYDGSPASMSVSTTSSTGKTWLRNLQDRPGNTAKLDAAATNAAPEQKEALKTAKTMPPSHPADVKDPKVALTDQPWFLPAVVGGSALVLLGVGVFVYRRYR